MILNYLKLNSFVTKKFLPLTCLLPVYEMLILQNLVLSTRFFANFSPLCNSITHQPIVLGNCLNAQDMQQVF